MEMTKLKEIQTLHIFKIYLQPHKPNAPVRLWRNGKIKRVQFSTPQKGLILILADSKN